MNTSTLRTVYIRLAGVLTLVVLLALVANALLSHRSFERVLAPQLAAKVDSVGASVRALAYKWVDLGVELHELHGVEQRFAEAMAEGPEISFMAITDPQGQVMYQSSATPPAAAAHFRSPQVLALLQGRPNSGPLQRVGDLYLIAMPMVTPTRVLGTLHLGVDTRFVDHLVLDMLYDVAVVLVVTLFFTLELLHFIAGARLEHSLRVLAETFERGVAGRYATPGRRGAGSGFEGLVQRLDERLAEVNRRHAALVERLQRHLQAPAHERPPGTMAAQLALQSLAARCRFGTESADDGLDQGQLAKVRAPLFMFILAEELTRSFVPGYVKDLLVPVPGVSPQLIVGLPIALFMLIVALGQPFLGVYCQRHGHRRTMLTGAAIAAAGFLATALAHNVLDLLLWRSLCAVGYAMVFVAGQSFVLDHATAAHRARSFAVFVGAIMAASVCGPSIGGILADNIGARPTFAIAALLAAGSMLVIRQLPGPQPRRQDRKPVRLPTLAEIGQLVANRRFMMVTGLAAIPAKLLLTGVCFYLVPLYVVSLDGTQAMAGRILMTYAVVMVVLGPLTAGLATSRARMHLLVGGGLLVSGLGATAMFAGSGVGWVFLAVVLVGTGQAMSISAQSALVAEHCAPEIRRLGDGVVYGVYRLLERMGNAAGPMVAAAVALHWDYRTGFVALGAAVALCGLLFLMATRGGSDPALVAEQPLETTT